MKFSPELDFEILSGAERILKFKFSSSGAERILNSSSGAERILNFEILNFEIQLRSWISTPELDFEFQLWSWILDFEILSGAGILNFNSGAGILNFNSGAGF